MRWREALHPVRIERVAVLAPHGAWRTVLVDVADAGTVAFDENTPLDGTTAQTPATTRLQRLQAGAAITAHVSASGPDLEHWEQDGRVDLIAGEAQLERRSAEAVTRGEVTALAGWMPAGDVPVLAGRVAEVGGAVVVLPRTAGAQPPTLLPQSGTAREFAPLVETYGTVPYADLNPSVLAGIAYVVMFGMMFADVGEGALLLLAALAVRAQWFKRLAVLRPVWLFMAGAGVASVVFGALYGEFFGPTGVIPVIWLAPLEHPIPLLGAAVAVGAVLLAGAYALGSVNRYREGGWRRAVYAPSGLAGAGLFLGVGALAAGIYFSLAWLIWLAVAITVCGLGVAFVGLFAAAGGGGSGVAQAAVELLDLVVRLCANVVSFARLAAFGLTHAALGAVTWSATTSLAKHGPIGIVAGVLVFVVGTAVSFSLELLIAAIQALRLEYYELFSRIFDIEGRPFRPWHVPLAGPEASC